jgi:hypothetical protein
VKLVNHDVMSCLVSLNLELMKAGINLVRSGFPDFEIRTEPLLCTDCWAAGIANGAGGVANA